MANKFYITTAIAYTSRKPHVGNTYEIVLTDAIARYRRLKGDDVYFLTGTDEHGQKIEDIAKEQGIHPKEYVDKIAGEIRGIWDLMNSSYDQFIRTTDEQHEKVVKKIFKKLYDQGDIYKGEYEGWYCVPCESFFTETQLVDGKCPDCGREVKKTTEEAYFFKMSKYQDRLMKHIEDHPDFIVPESRKKEMVNNFLKPGLQDLCVSRTSFTWGIPVDFDPKHVVYVWIDALSNYITALGYDPDGSSELFKKYWPADIHVIGKDILRFHTIYWPIMLMALDVELPKQIFGHPWMLFGKDKMSKSTGNVIYADDLANLFSVDATRYYMLSEMPYGQDGAITYETVIARFNSDLANTLGNLVNRTIAMSNKYFEGEVSNPNVTEPVDSELIECCRETVASFIKQMDDLRLADTLDTIMDLARRSNKYIDETAPWTLAKDEANHDRLRTVLFHLIESIRYIGVMLSPFMPETAEKIFAQLNCNVITLESLSDFGNNGITKVGEAAPLFNRIDEAKKMEEINAMNEKYKQAAAVKAEEKVEGVQIGIEDFQKVSLTVAQILECAKVPKSDKLYQLILDDGNGKRQVVSGIAKWYSDSDLIGKKVIIVANLKPVKLRGVESNGMILAADCPNDDVKVIFVDDTIPAGSKIR
ncbi:methionine--tRNA ligase [Paludicola sp. MB14-C6]|uniref:methionine--tRNA ligase n=1 Tax=Paludihabitans sp. MB14-C6 TaxID=3070656 RepID=UPI0027DC0170|nr:methionine--tRNA ligase [Paludicola sp. MB14-C6]WMJ23506.1 methionine--tRNA ligase [Paludicola sp. MB14-C6]